MRVILGIIRVNLLSSGWELQQLFKVLQNKLRNMKLPGSSPMEKE
jgi:hypothetical protein